MKPPPEENAATVSTGTDAIVIRNATKRFKKRTVRREYTTVKSELVNWLLRRSPTSGAASEIEALRGIDLTIPRGKTVGILGRNGSGKSTLLKLITGIYGPSSGTVQVNGRVSALLDLGAGFHPDFSGRENILINGIILGMSRAEVRARMDEIIAFSELGDFIDEPVRTYSSGMYMRLAFAVATHVDPDILIVDEILAVGDEHFSKKSLARMTEFKRSGKTIILVTHDLGTVERWCDVAAWIDGGKIREFGFPPNVVEHYKEAVRLAEASEKPFTPPALSADGGALPAVAGAVQGQPSSAPMPSVTSLRICDSRGAQVSQLDVEQPCTMQAELRCPPDAVEVSVLMQISSAQGQLVYCTSSDVDGVALPSPLPPNFSFAIELERLGLVAGQYILEVQLHERGGAARVERLQQVIAVTSSVTDSGLYRPKHKWRVAGATVTVLHPDKVAASDR
ncbi:MAG: ABC transporter ATP-binding protein [Myxococcaceae bacterium]